MNAQSLFPSDSPFGQNFEGGQELVKAAVEPKPDSGPSTDELEDWYLRVMDLIDAGGVADIDALEELRDEIYRYLR